MVFCPLQNIGFLEGAHPIAAELPLCQLSAKRLEDNWHSGILSSAKHRLSGRRSPDCRRANHLRSTGSRTPDSRCFVEDKTPLCQLSSKRLEDNWHSGLFFFYIHTLLFPVQSEAKAEVDKVKGQFGYASVSYTSIHSCTHSRWHAPSSRHLRALLSVYGRCSLGFGVLFLSCVYVSMSGVLFCLCVCVTC